MVKRRTFLVNTSGATLGLAALAAKRMGNDAALASEALGTARSATESRAHSAGGSKLSASLTAVVLDPTYIDSNLDSRSISFENPRGSRSGGGKAANGRKGSPFHILEPGEKVVLADIGGPGTVRHIWMTLGSWPPEVMRAQRFEVFYDGLREPSISVPVLDFFGLPHGRCAEYYSAMTSINEGRGLNSHIPMPFRRSIRVEITNESARHVILYYQMDYTLEPSIPENSSYLHVTFRRENPTTLRQDFVIADGLKGPGRFLGCSVGIRIIDTGAWYGEGELKIYRDGDRESPTICGTGLEDYVGSAYGLGRHYGSYSGAPINILAPSPDADAVSAINPNFVSFYRWHLPDPVMFAEQLRVTIQQIGGSAPFRKGQEIELEAYRANHQVAGPGWVPDAGTDCDSLGFAIMERRDDYCATAFVYCRKPQPVSRFRTDLAVRDIGLLPGEARAKPFMSEDQLIKLKTYWGGRRVTTE